jgi:hypothetical protein
VIVSRRALAKLFVAVLAAAAFYASFWESPEARVRTLLEKLARALRRGSGKSEEAWARALEKTFSAGMVPGVRLEVPELESVEGREQVIELAMQTRGVLEVALDPSGIRIDEDRAHARLSLSITSHLPGSVRREQRGASVELVREDGVFRVRSIEIEEALREEPEARP